MNSKIEEKIDKIEEKVDKVVETQSETNLHLAVYNAQLKVHISGTIQNREEIAKLRIDLKPVEDHVKFVQGLIKLVLAISTIAGVVFAGIELFVK